MKRKERESQICIKLGWKGASDNEDVKKSYRYNVKSIVTID